jgi:hypothetical protein
MAMDEQPTEPRHQSWRVPLRLGGLGLALMIAGYFLLHPEPLRDPQREEQEKKLADLREMAEADPTQRELARDLAEIQGQASIRWGRLLGIVAFWVGLILFIGAGIQMYRHPAEADAEGLHPDEPPEEAP